MTPSILIDQGLHLPLRARRFFDPVLEQAFVAENARLIIKAVTKARLDASKPIDDVQSLVEEWVCMHMPHWCERKMPTTAIKRDFTKQDVLAFVAAVKGTIEAGGVVSKEEANRRAGICFKCPYNTKIAGCEGCNGIASLVFGILGARKLHNAGALKSCGVCGCNLKAKTWVPKEVLDNLSQVQDNREDYPAWCWNR